MFHIPAFLIGYQQLIKLGIADRDNDVGEKAVHLVGCYPAYCQIWPLVNVRVL